MVVFILTATFEHTGIRGPFPSTSAVSQSGRGYAGAYSLRAKERTRVAIQSIAGHGPGGFVILRRGLGSDRHFGHGKTDGRSWIACDYGKSTSIKPNAASI